MDNIETGLYLPIRFYQSLNEQDRHKRHSLGVALTELNYPVVSCISLAPFQILHAIDSSVDYYPNTVTIDIICADTNVVTPLTYNGQHWDFTNQNDLFWLSYLGSEDWSGVITNDGLFYLEVYFEFASGNSATYYSDLFYMNCTDDSGSGVYDVEEFRVHSQLAGDNKRLIDVTDLRITKS